MIREILKMGDPRLLRVARPVEDLLDPALPGIIADMYETMQAANGVGLAAPQIGVDLRLMVFGFEASPRYPEAAPVPPTTLINPWLEVLGGATAVPVGSGHARNGASRHADSLWWNLGRWQLADARGRGVSCPRLSA